MWYCELEGTNYEIGRQLAHLERTEQRCFKAPDFFVQEDFEEAFQLYEEHCPGIMEELRGYSDESGIGVQDIAFSWMTYLVPRCCGLILTGGRTCDGHTKIARSYEFSLEEEDLKVCRTAAAGRYAHTAGSIAGFGRTEGINEKGLAVSMSSCGFPVSNMPMMKEPRIKGLQFWLVIRSLLENCADVEEALNKVQEMPIAYNINLYLADASGNAALFETMDGEQAFRQIRPGDGDSCLYGTNHIVIDSLRHLEPAAMKNSIVRYDKLKEFTESGMKFEEQAVKDMLLQKYPGGMRANYYKEGFGTIKSVILDTVEKRFSICWLGLAENGWKDYFVLDKQEDCAEEKEYETEEGVPDFFAMVGLL